MKITLIYVIGRCSDTSRNAGRGSVGGLLQIFAAPASRPAGVISINGESNLELLFQGEKPLTMMGYRGYNGMILCNFDYFGGIV